MLAEPTSILPPEILKIIRRKSSRDPVARFSNKLHMLLGFAGDDRDLQESLGLGWIDDNQFRINKKRLIITMEIKLNTLNVNLKDLKFRQVRVDKDGWTVWDRAGFTRESTPDDLADVRADGAGDGDRAGVLGSEEQLQTKMAVLREISLGMTDSAALKVFKSVTISIWEELVPSPTPRYIVDSEGFIEACAKRFRVSHQKLDNALSIMRAIFLRPEVTQVSVVEFGKFMARFGPEETLMLKIQSILKSSNENHNWLKIDGDQAKYKGELVYGFFDECEHNCFVIQRHGMEPERVYNKVEEAANQDYLVDETGRTYASWQAYFEAHPVRKATTYEWV